MKLYFGGTEITTHTKLLTELGVKNMALSYMGLRRRVKFAKPWNIKDKYPEDVSVFLDSGGYTINGETEYSEAEIEDIAAHYRQFVSDNIDDIEMVSEFDALAMGPEWVEYQRREFYDHLPREKFMAIWHPEWWDVSYLVAMAERYSIIGVKDVDLNDRSLVPVLNAIVAKGVHLHGISMTKIETMKAVKWGSVASTSWISPAQYGDTIVWTGNELKRYPKKYKDQARTKHRMWFKQNGFDSDAIEDPENKTEVLRLSVWSWLQFENSLNKHQQMGSRVTHPFSDSEAPNVDPTASTVVHLPDPAGNQLTTTTPREPQVLPTISFDTRKDPKTEEESSFLNVRGKSARVCDSCFLAEKCPMYEPSSTCVYDIPVTVKTRQDRKDLQNALLEMQAQRVLFMKFVEDKQGGYADPNLTKEMNTLTKMLTATEKMEAEGFDVSLRVRGSGQLADSGRLSRLFGNDAAAPLQEIEGGPYQVEDIYEAEVLDEGGNQ